MFGDNMYFSKNTLYPRLNGKMFILIIFILMDYMGFWDTQKGNELKDFGFTSSTKITSIMELSVLINTQSIQIQIEKHVNIKINQY